MAGLTNDTPPTVDDPIIHSSTTAPPDSSSSKAASAESPSSSLNSQITERFSRNIPLSMEERMRAFHLSGQGRGNYIYREGKLPTRINDETSIIRESESLSSNHKSSGRRGWTGGRLSNRSGLKKPFNMDHTASHISNTVDTDLPNKSKEGTEGVEDLVDNKTHEDLGPGQQ